jgi:hypothetical protein
MVPNIPNIYTFGKIKYDAEPLMRTFSLIQRKRDAVNAAFDKYLESQQKTVDLNKVRTQDQEAFQDMFNNLKRVGIENKKMINSDLKSKLDYEAEWRKLSNFAAKSIGAEKTKDPYLQRMSSREGRLELNNTRFSEALESHDLPMFVKDASGTWVANPTRQELDVTKDYFTPKPINFANEFRNWAANKERIEIPGEIIQNDMNTPEGKGLAARMKIKQRVAKGYTPSAVKEIGEAAYRDVRFNDPVLNYYEREFENIKNSDELMALDMTLKKYFPKETITDAALLAKAQALKAAEDATETYAIDIDDEAAKRRYQELQRAKAQARADQRAKMRASGGELTNPFDRINATFAGGSVKNGVVADASGKPFTGEIELKEDQIPPYLRVGLSGLSLKAGAKIKFTVKNGVIQDMTPGRSMTNMFATPPKITRDDINAGIELKLPSAKRGVFGGGGEGDNPLELEF